MTAKNSYDMIQLDDEQAVIALKIDRNRIFRIEKHLVVLFQGDHRVGFHLRRNSHDSTGNRGNFNIVRQPDSTFGFFFILVFPNQYPFAYGLDGLEIVFEVVDIEI